MFKWANSMIFDDFCCFFIKYSLQNKYGTLKFQCFHRSIDSSMAACWPIYRHFGSSWWRILHGSIYFSNIFSHKKLNLSNCNYHKSWFQHFHAYMHKNTEIVIVRKKLDQESNPGHPRCKWACHHLATEADYLSPRVLKANLRGGSSFVCYFTQ